MSLYKGNREIKAVYNNSREIASVYKGEQLVYQNKPSQWLMVTPNLTTLKSGASETTVYGDCKGRKQMNVFGLKAGWTTSGAGWWASDWAWYQGSISVTGGARDALRFYYYDDNGTYNDSYAGAGIYLNEPIKTYGICVTMTYPSGWTPGSAKLVIFVRYSDNTYDINTSVNPYAGKGIVKFKVLFDSSKEVSDIIISQNSTTAIPISYAGIYLLAQGGTLGFEQIPGTELL